MRLGFWLTTPKLIEYHPDKIPMGGAERSAINLSRKLSGFFPVSVFGNFKKSAVTIYDDNLYDVVGYKYSDLIRHSELDVLICVRADPNLLNPRSNHVHFGENKPKIILWTGDAWDQPNNQLLHDKYCRKEIDLIVCKSNWQRDTLLKYFPTLSPSEVRVMYNGVDADYIRSLPLVAASRSPSFVYASTAYRGLHKFLTIWPKIKERIPDATLDCYCKTTLYLDDNQRESEFQGLYDKISALPEVTIKEPLSQKAFLRELSKYRLMLYPNDNFLESSCGVALQSMACGVPVITTNSAGLEETVDFGNGHLVDVGDDYDNDFARRVDVVYNKKGMSDIWENEGRDNILNNYSWEKVSERWEQLLQTVAVTEKQNQSKSCQEYSLA